MKLYLNLKNGIPEIEASETPVKGFEPYELRKLDDAGVAAPCRCIYTMDVKLREEGFKLVPLMALAMPELKAVYGLPLLRSDGSKLKAGDPKTIAFSHCPFCGAPLNA